MWYLRAVVISALIFFGGVMSASAVNGLVTKPSTYSTDDTLDRLEAALKERGFMIFTRLDHAAAARSSGLEMPRSTVLVFGNPRAGTPRFIQVPTLAIDLPLKALVWEDGNGKVWLTYNNSEWLKVIDDRHGVASPNSEAATRADAVLDTATDVATK